MGIFSTLGLSSSIQINFISPQVLSSVVYSSCPILPIFLFTFFIVLCTFSFCLSFVFQTNTILLLYYLRFFCYVQLLQSFFISYSKTLFFYIHDFFSSLLSLSQGAKLNFKIPVLKSCLLLWHNLTLILKYCCCLWW